MSNKKKGNEASFEDLFMNNSSDTEKEKNHIYFYSDVTKESCLDLNRKINDLNKELLKLAIEYEIEPPNIYLHINSFGGCIYSALSTIDTILNSKIPVISIIEGSAASAATLISMVCHKRYMMKNSYMLIHQLSTGAYGKYAELRDEYINNKKFMSILYKLYYEHTTMDINTIKKLMKHDLWLDYEECLNYGIIDDIYNGDKSNLTIRNHHNSNSYSSNNINKKRRLADSVDCNDSDDDIDDIIPKKTKKRKTNK
jgi:ATP-dependent Clp protease protease subunit